MYLVTESNNDQLKSVSNALRILEYFSNTRTVIYVSEIAKEMNLSKSTVSRLVRTLEKEKFLEKDIYSQGYILGKKILAIAGVLSNTNEIYRELSPVLSDIVQATKESAQIAALDGTDVYYISKISGPYYADINTQIGLKHPFHATGTGKVLMAYQDEATIDAALSQDLEAFTEHTLTNPIRVRKELSKVKEQGYSLSIEEMTYGNYSLAFPVRNYENKVVCSLSIVGPLSRVNNQKLKEYMHILRDATMDASERLGYEP
ncbi:IclR family transcriptional regulator [Aerococcus agrisoli]|uniref:IclR family transcriptional regulator n=1 Tax=Aerococcus agrisoli TaxID=2487350 RepID=A0A3N4GMW6_9LACT|nr:IclR family transcriptional regulator [Aerococcus agrisoli]